MLSQTNPVNHFLSNCLLVDKNHKNIHVIAGRVDKESRPPKFLFHKIRLIVPPKTEFQQGDRNMACTCSRSFYYKNNENRPEERSTQILLFIAPTPPPPPPDDFAIIHLLKGKFSSGIEGALASTLHYDFNWKQLSEMMLCIVLLMFSKFIYV